MSGMRGLLVSGRKEEWEGRCRSSCCREIGGGVGDNLSASDKLEFCIDSSYWRLLILVASTVRRSIDRELTDA